MTVDLELPAHPDSIRQARSALRKLDVPAQTLEDMRLLVSEVVTNAVRHAGIGPNERIRVNVVVRGDRVRVRVCDRGPGFRPLRAVPEPGTPGGYGLYLVDRIADRWGVDQGKANCVWFELTAAA